MNCPHCKKNIPLRLVVSDDSVIFYWNIIELDSKTEHVDFALTIKK